jgi:hypothetical protein
MLGAFQAMASNHVPVKWDGWYTVTVLPATPYAYYNEKVETTGGKIHFKTQTWKQEEGYINEEQLGAFALDNDLLTPLFYNFHSTYRANELTIDGTASEGRLKVRIKKVSEQEADRPVIQKGLPSKAFFSSFFPIWVTRQIAAKASTGSFYAILEDNEAQGFSPVDGSYRVLEGDEFSKSTKSTRIEVKFAGNKSIWYLEPGGMTVRIELPGQKTRVDRVTEKKATSFFNKDGK